MPREASWLDGILTARPRHRPPSGEGGSGTRAIGLGGRRDGLVHVPASIEPGQEAALLVMLHGAGASAYGVVPMVLEAAEEHSVIVMAPDSRGPTWDAIGREFGPDVEFIDTALEALFESHPIDPRRVAVGGFSDGASYALSLGLTNGLLFSDILAFSPGFAAATRLDGRPAVFISHGLQDPVLPIERCGRRVAASLKRSGYDVDYREFTGGHVVPADMVAAAFARFLA